MMRASSRTVSRSIAESIVFAGLSARAGATAASAGAPFARFLSSLRFLPFISCRSWGAVHSPFVLLEVGAQLRCRHPHEIAGLARERRRQHRAGQVVLLREH